MPESSNHVTMILQSSCPNSDVSVCDDNKNVVLPHSVKANAPSKIESELLHAPSVHMHLGKGISKVREFQRLTSQPNEEIFLSCDYSASLAEDDLLSLFEDSVCPSHPPKRKRSEDLK
uniref:Uncharacterized protein n=1 Tax=Cryptomonas curvata TaxID=233186 RepID=A0A7S0MSU4_9CRYP